MLPTLFLISATLFALVSWFCKSQGLFESGSMGIGQMLAAGLYLVIWVGGTILATVAAILTAV